MASPQFLIIEMRIAFRSCARQHQSSHTRSFHSYTSRRDQTRSNPPPPPPPPPAKWPYNGAIPQRNSSQPHPPHSQKAQTSSSQTDLTPRQPSQTSVSTDRRVPVPMKVIPNPDLGASLRLTPRERLHVEILTRRARPVQPEKKIYRERLQIYHMGALKENVMAILKVSSIVCACAVTFVIAPAHLHAGHSLWLVGSIFLGGFVPGFLVNYMTLPMVSRVFLNLPAKARETPKAAMEYAKNLPQTAELDIRYLKPWGLEDSVRARLSELEPTNGNLLRPLTFKWMDRFARRDGWIVKNPTSFYVAEQTAMGEASKNTIPGIWGSVYQRLVHASGRSVAKWSKTEPQMQLR